MLQDFFCHRALEAIPEVVTPEATPTSPEAIRVRCQLLLQSGCTNAEMLSLQLLLGHALWSDALSLVQQNRGKVRPAVPTLYNSTGGVASR